MLNQRTAAEPDSAQANDRPGKPLRVSEVAARFDVHESTIYRAITSGQLSAFRVGTGRGAIRIPVAALAAYESRISTPFAVEVA